MTSDVHHLRASEREVLRAFEVCSVLVANTFAGYVTVVAGTSGFTLCADTFTSPGTSGCVSGSSFEFGAFQLAVVAAMTASLLCLGAYLLRELRWCLIAALALSAAFVVVPAAYAAPSVFKDSGSVQLPRFGRQGSQHHGADVLRFDGSAPSAGCREPIARYNSSDAAGLGRVRHRGRSRRAQCVGGCAGAAGVWRLLAM